MGLLDGKRILLGISGGIAAYKTPELVRRLQDAGADVEVVVTSAATRFVSAIALETVSGHPVHQDLWESQVSGDGAGAPQSRIVHTDIGQDVDLILLAPATANLIGRIAHGLADDLLTTSVMACNTPVLLCPAMNTDMLANPLVQRNIETLESLPRYTALHPGVGLLACGVTGPGRMPDPPQIIEAAAATLSPKPLLGKRVTLSAGPTRERIDPVRFISNRSTGTMGFALARSFAAAGAEVTLVAGPVALATPVGVAKRVDVVSAEDMRVAIEAQWSDTDVLVMTAAVADYRPADVASQKIKKGDGSLAMSLERTVDILASTVTADDRHNKCVIGFAAETQDVETYALGKLERKGLDFIVANDVSSAGVGFGGGDNAGLLLGKDGSRTVIQRCSKQVFADTVVNALSPHLVARGNDA